MIKASETSKTAPSRGRGRARIIKIEMLVRRQKGQEAYEKKAWRPVANRDDGWGSSVATASSG